MNTNLDSCLKKYDIAKPEITKENKFSMISIEHLVKILNDQTLVDHHEYILKGFQFIVNRIGKDSIQFFPLIITSILNTISIEGGGPGLGKSFGENNRYGGSEGSYGNP